MEQKEINHIIEVSKMPDLARIQNTLGKMEHYLGNHNAICVGVSGGSDSDIIVHMIVTYFRHYLEKIHFVLGNTGIEYQATKDHLDYLEERYGIEIEEIKGRSVVGVVHECGVPVLSKEYSNKVEQYAKGNQSGKDWYEGRWRRPTGKQKALADAIKERHIRVSCKCCDISKKQPFAKYYRENGIDLVITGERRAEGGQRATRHSSCFEPNSHGGKYDKYMPLFFWDDATKAYYKEQEGIRYSDCYEVWG